MSSANNPDPIDGDTNNNNDDDDDVDDTSATVAVESQQHSDDFNPLDPSIASVPSIDLNQNADSIDPDQSAEINPGGSSDDSDHYGGVYYGSSDDDNIGALLADIGETDENNDPYDILADNGEYLYSEEDQRPYVTTTPSLDLLSAAGTPSQIMSPIMEEEEEHDTSQVDTNMGEQQQQQLDDGGGTGALLGNPNPNDRMLKSKVRENLFLQPSRPLPSTTPMYRIPQDYTVSNSDRYGGVDYDDAESEDDSVSSESTASSSSRVPGSIKQTVRHIDNVLDSLSPRDPRKASGDYTNLNERPSFDDTTIVSDVTAGATSRLSEELDNAKNVYVEFTGIDLTNRRMQQKKKKKKKTPSNQPPTTKTSDGSKETDRIKTIAASLGIAVLIGTLITIYFVLRRNHISTETTVNANVRDDSSSPIGTNPPTFLPIADIGVPSGSPSMKPVATTVNPSSSSSDKIYGNSGMPSMKPSAMSSLLPDLSSKPSQHPTVKTIKSIFAPTIMPTAFQSTTSTASQTEIPVIDSDSMSSSRRPTMLRYNSYYGVTQPPTSEGSIRIWKDKDNTGEDFNSNSGEFSFDMPDDSKRPWDDDEFQPKDFRGNDDFYSTDDTYEYELHHPHGSKATKKKSKSYGYYDYYSETTTSDQYGYYSTKNAKARRNRNYIDVSPYAPPPLLQPYWHWSHETLEEEQPHIISYRPIPYPPQHKHYQQLHQHEHPQAYPYQLRHQYHEQFGSREYSIRPLPQIVRESATTIRSIQRVPRGYYGD
mmetsp:Transcript_3832/g.10060  ORF Transcript_3832/g.10060 Transcript_3832/m.10060 type:complete len:763 (+) Transcript_3832:199-2487(+)